MTENPENPDKNPYFTWRQFFKILSGFGTQEELRQYIHARSFDREDDEHALCERYRDKLLRTSPLIIFLQENCRKLGAELNSSNIVCRRCDTLSKFPISSKFSEAGGIVLCQNHVPTYGEMEDKLAHEMVHAYDHLRFNYDYRNIRHRACAEIRAAMLSGECRWSREFFGQHQWTKFHAHFQTCVKRRAVMSVVRHPKCEDEDHAKRVVNTVFGSCFADTRPFDEVYK